MPILITSSLWTLSDLERSKSRSFGLQDLISRKGAELGPMSLLSINRKPYMASPMTPSLLTLSDLKGQSQAHSDSLSCLKVKVKVTRISNPDISQRSQVRPYITN